MTSSCIDLALLAPPPPGQGPLTVHRLRELVEQRLPGLPSWRWRLATVPLGLDHPVWIDDPDFDLGYHLRQATIDAPGGDAELDAYVAGVLPDLLDLRHPLWQITLLDGLRGGRQALVFRFHHSIADGAALLTTLDRLFGSGPLPDPDRRPWEPVAPRPRRLFADAVRDQARNWAEAPRLLRTTLARFKQVEQRKQHAVAPVPRPMADAPRTVLNDSYTAERAYRRLLLPTASLQRVKAAAGSTLNDVVLAVVSGGLRTYLAERGALPAEPLVANVPVANEVAGAPPRQHGNRFANFFTTLATDLDDPWARLAAISAGTVEAKLQLDLQGRDTLPDWLDRLPPAVAVPAARAMARRARAAERSDFNVLVSNVRVTATDWAFDGRAVEHMFMSGPVADGAGLNVTITGFGPDLHVSLVANPHAVADLSALADAMVEALDELVARASTAAAPSGAPAPAGSP